jgi:hypothetical protein
LSSTPRHAAEVTAVGDRHIVVEVTGGFAIICHARSLGAWKHPLAHVRLKLAAEDLLLLGAQDDGASALLRLGQHHHALLQVDVLPPQSAESSAGGSGAAARQEGAGTA